MPPDTNGAWKQLEEIGSDVKEIKDDLSHSVDKLSQAVDRLTEKFDNFIHVAQNSIPVKAVFWLMGIMVLGLVGVEGAKNLGGLAKFWLGMP